MWHVPSSKIEMKRIRPEQNERRFYVLEISRDLFGTVLLLRNWGRIGTDGRMRFDLYPDVMAASIALAELATTKRRRGYLDVTRSCEPHATIEQIRPIRY
jgi:predicted DNA-binding WGR domain protein